MINEELKQLKQAISNPNNLSLNFGLGAALLSTFLKENDYLQTQELIHPVKKSLVIMNLQLKRTSFFVGPLGFLWALDKFETVNQQVLFPQEQRELFLEKFINLQESYLLKNPQLLDFLYGITGWFIAYDLFSSSQKERIHNIFLDQVENLLEEYQLKNTLSIYKQVELNQKFTVEKSNGNLGFSHGIGSIAYILLNFFNCSRSKKFYSQIQDIIKKNYHPSKGLSRNINDNDYTRQDWCHGVLSYSLLDISKKDTQQSLKLYNSIHEEGFYGVCHGIGHKYLLNLIKDKVFHFESHELKEINLEIDKYEYNFENFSMINSYTFIKLVEENKDLNLWKIVYPKP